jgi:hypothetical protein
VAHRDSAKLAHLLASLDETHPRLAGVRRAAFFARTGLSVVEEHLRGHYRADGGARETTLGYQAGSMLDLWDFLLVAQRNGWPLAGDFGERLLRATRFLLGLMSPAGGLPSFGDTGYAALRRGDTPGAEYLAVAAADRGPIVTSHGHNDVLAIEVHAGGTRFIGEMGCAPSGDSPGRRYDQTTAAHSTLAIAGREQADIVNEWRWSSLCIPAVRRWISEPTHDFFHGVHEGFYRWPERQTLHARKILFVKAEPAYWLIVDWLESNVENDCAVRFHGCVPGRIRGRDVLLGTGAARLALLPATAGLRPLSGAKQRADDKPCRTACGASLLSRNECGA